MRAPRLIVLGSLALSAGCARPENTAATTDSTSGAVAATSADAGAVRASIDSLNAKFADAAKRGDTAAIALIYTDDASVMMSNAEAWRGREAIAKGWGGIVSGGTLKEFSLKTDDVEVGGDLVVETGKYEMTVAPKGAKEMKDRGKYIVVWKRQPDGSLKIFRDIGNSDLPATQ